MDRRRFLQGSAAFLGAAALAACGAGEAPTLPTSTPGRGSRKLTPATLQFITNHSAAEVKDFQEVVRNFNKKYPDIKIKLQNIADTEQFYTKINTLGVGKNLPDAWYTRTFDVASNAVKGWQEPLGAYIDRDAEEVNVDDIWPALVSQMTYQGELYALPYNISNFVVYYSKKIFEEEGIEPPSPDWTWQQAAELASRFVVREGGRQKRWGINFVTYDWAMRGTLAANGGKVFSDDFRECVVNSPENVETFEFFYRLQQEGTAPKAGATPQGIDPFPAGLLAMDANGSWVVTGYRDAIGKRFDWDLVHLPKGTTGDRGISTAGGAWGISAYSRYKDQAWEFLKHLASEESINLMVSRRLLSIPGRKSCMDVYNETARSSELPPQSIEVIEEEMNNALESSYPPYQAEFGTIWSNHVQGIFAGQPVEQQLAKIESDTNKVAARYFK
jgi:multiple sugar transport system substrate-binding protein